MNQPPPHSIEEFSRKVDESPSDPEAHYNLGNILRWSGREKEGIECYLKAIALNPDHADALNNLGAYHWSRGQLGKAIGYLERAVQARPDFPEAHNNLGCVYKNQGRLDEALKAFKTAASLRPNYPLAESNFLYALNAHPDYSAREIFEAHRKWGERIVDHAPPIHSLRQGNKERYRIAYLSPDFRTHSVSYFIKPILTHHDRERFRVFCYSDVRFPDKTTHELKTIVEDWRDISGFSDEEVLNLIQEDRIDILVDLAGHTANNRLPIFAKKPAPIQITYLGYPNTTGLPTMDYRITDSWVDLPSNTGREYTEKLIRLPCGFLCYAAPEALELNLSSKTTKEGIVFGSFNALPKTTPKVVRIWAEILKQVPRAKMFLKNNSFADPETRTQYLRLFQEEGIAEERLVFRSWAASTAEHLQFYHEIDVALDTFPYNGTTTTCEALWMGVPVITLEGQTPAGRVGTSLLHRIGHSEWIAATEKDYVRLATSLANNPQRLSIMKKNLRSECLQSPLMEATSITRSIEEEYLKVFKKEGGGK